MYDGNGQLSFDTIWGGGGHGGEGGFGKGSFLQMADHVYTKRPHKLVLLNHTRLNNY